MRTGTGELVPEAGRFLTPGFVVSTAATALGTFLLFSNVMVAFARRGLLPTAAAAIVPGLLLLAVLHRLVIRRQPLIVDRTLLVMLAFLAVLLASAFAARGYSEALSRITVFVVEGLVTYFLIRNAIQGVRDLRAALVAVVLAASLLAGLAVVQAVTGRYEQEFLGLAQRSIDHLAEGAGAATGEMGLEDRARGPVGEPNRFAQILLMALPFALVFRRNAASRMGATVALGAAAVVLGGVVLTYSRGGFVTLVLMMLMTIPLRLMSARTVFAMFAAGALAAPVVAPAYAARVLSISGVAGLLSNDTQVEADGPTRGRTTEMLAALAAYTEHAILGVGPGQYVPYYSVHYQALPEISIREIAEPRRAHSLYLEMAAEVGTVGLAIFLLIPLLLLRDLRALRLELYRRRPDLARLAAGFSLMLVAYLGTGVFLHIAFERYYWFMVGLAAAAAGVLERLAAELESYRQPNSWARRPTSL